jgi:hypothetical protein
MFSPYWTAAAVNPADIYSIVGGTRPRHKSRATFAARDLRTATRVSSRALVAPIQTANFDTGQT